MRFDNGYAIVEAEVRGPTLVLAFGGLGLVGRDNFPGNEYLRKCGFSFVSFVPKVADWYPDKSFALSPEIDAMIEPLTDRVTYGYSMGGHAALKAAGLFRATRVVASCPQYSIDPAVVKDHRYNKYWNEHAGTHDMMHEPSAARRMVVCDQDFAIDRQHLELIADGRPIEVMHCAGAGHEIWEALTKRGMTGVEGIFTQAIKGELTPDTFAEQYDRQRAA